MISTLPIGSCVDRYQIQGLLGKGGFGITYVAVDTQIGLRVAIKELLPDTIATRAEGATVVPQTESMWENWQWARDRFVDYMVMDFVDGESYEARLRRIGREPDEGSLMAVMGPLMDGLGEVHAKGLLHRDIKPDNILINHRGQPILIDFGAAREVVGATVSMTSIVTHGYSPFEQYQGNAKLGPSADIYSLGAVMCRAVTGEKPPVGTERVLEDSFVPLATRPLEGFSIGFLDCIDRALAVRAEYRPQSIAEFKAAIQGQQGTIKLDPQMTPPVPLTKPPAIPTAGKRPGKNPLLSVIAVAATVLVLGAGFWWVLKSKKNDSGASFADDGKSIAAMPTIGGSPVQNSIQIPPQESNVGAGKIDEQSESKERILQLEPGVVNIGGTNPTRYLRARVTLELVNSANRTRAEQNFQKLSDAASKVLSSQPIAVLDSPGGRETLRAALLSTFNEELSGKYVEQIYFNELIIL